MIDDIRNWFGDIASGRIKDAQLALTKEQATTFERRLLDSETELAAAANRIFELEAENENLRAQLEQFHGSQDRLTKEEEQILHFFFEKTESSREQASRSLGVPLPEVTHHVASLIKRDFLQHSRGAMGQGRPALQKIRHAGSDYVMQNMREQGVGPDAG